MMLTDRSSEKLLLKLIDNADVLFLYVTPQEEVALANSKVCDTIGLPLQQIIGNHWSKTLYRDAASNIQQQMFKAMIDDVVTYRRPNNFEGVVTDKDQIQKLFSWGIIPIYSQTQDLEGILLVGHDVTEIRQRDTAVKKIDETLKNIFGSIKEYALYVANLDGNITYYAMGSATLLGWEKNEIVFKHVSMLHTPEDAKTDLPYMLEQVRLTGQFETEIMLVRKNSEQVPVILTINQFVDSQGQLSGYVFMAKDITERKKLEYQIFQSEKLAAIGQLAAGMAHEINNPLFVISGRLEMLLEEETLSDRVKQDVGIVINQAERIRRLVDRLLKFARKSPPKLEAIDISEAIEGVLPLLTYHRLPAAHVEIEKNLPRGLPLIKGDLNQVQEVFLNLFINAHQAMPDGGTLSIVSRDCGNRFVEVRISDTGSGISEQNMRNIFMPFFTTKKEGTGLGLSIVFNIVKNHGGTVDIETQIGKGTTFVVRLPYA